ncbi:MAG TPA: alpha-L-arabinofuranosidase C-terminal domain-containing protein, partial [Microlunatus sp.]|nr:alpha-L-arabinofuranosidase C-terminal domain-containing protein [Microlunatus sp.]
QAQLVNVIGLLRSEPGGEAWKQTIAYPFEQMARLARGQILQVVATSDLFDSDAYTDVPVVDATATYDAETGRAAVFVANRSLNDTASLEVDLRGIGGTAVRGATTLHARDGQDRHATNTTEHQAVVPVRFDDHAVGDGQLTATLPALSWTVFELDARREG